MLLNKQLRKLDDSLVIAAAQAAQQMLTTKPPFDAEQAAKPAEMLAFLLPYSSALKSSTAAEALGMSLPTYQQYERAAAFAGGAPRIAPRWLLLACAAIEAGIEPIGRNPL